MFGSRIRHLLAILLIASAAHSEPSASQAAVATPYDAVLRESRDLPWWRRELNEFRVYPHRQRFYQNMADGQSAAALEELKHILKVDPDNDWARFQILRIHYQDDRLQDAIAWADRLIARRPGFAPAHYFRGLTHYEAGRRADAARDLTHACTLGGLTQAHQERANHVLQTIALEETFVTGLTRRRPPVSAPPPRAKAAPKPAERSPKAHALAPAPAPPAAYRHMHTALARLKAGKTVDALRQLDAAKKAGTGPIADLYRGYALKRLNRPRAAAAAFEAALAATDGLAPAERAAAWRETGYLAAAGDDHEGAIAAWDRALSIEANPALAVRLARLLRLTGRWDRAKARLESVSEDDLDPSLHGLYDVERAALAWREAARDDAIAWQERAVAAEPSAMRWSRLGHMRAAEGQDRQAITAFEKALALTPENATLRAALGYAQYAAGDLEDARRSLTRAAAKLGSPGPVYEDLGYLNLRLDSPKKAGAWFRKAIDAAQSTLASDARRHELRLKQEVEWIENRIDLTGYSIHRSNGVSPLTPNPLGRTLLRSGGGIAASVIPPGLGHETGRHLQAFGRLLWSYEDHGIDIAGRSLQGGIGLRGKPFAAHDFVFSTERLIAAGDAARDDWMFRASYSWSKGLDPWFSAADRNAPAARMFLDIAAVDPADPDIFATAEGFLGWGLRRGRGWLVWPHVMIAGTVQDDDFGSISLLEAGPGLGMRVEFGESRYRAYVAAAEMFVQYRAKVAGDSRGGSGVTLVLNVTY